MEQPLVSCLCATYGRPILLGEAIKCFIDQDYSNKELIVLSDQVGVHLKLSIPLPENIRIYEHPRRFDSLGQKRNYLRSLARGQYCCIWDDDDLYTPFRISESVKYALENPDSDIIKAKSAVMSVDNKDYNKVSNLFHSQAIITRDYMFNHEYPEVSVGEDSKFEEGARVKSIDVSPFFWYVYRWGMDTHHVSGLSDHKASWERSLYFYKDMQGDILVKVEFQNDYWSHIKDYMNNINPNLGKIWYDKIGRVE